MYIELAELASDVPAILDLDERERLAGIVAQVINKMSRIFDAETFAPEGYYAMQPTDVFVKKDFRTNGTNFLQTYHFTELEDVFYKEDSLLDRAIIGRGGQYIELGYINFLRIKSILSVSAKWGWLSIPEDVKQAITAKCLLRLSLSPLARNGLDFSLRVEDLPQLNAVWDNTVMRYRNLNQFAYS